MTATQHKNKIYIEEIIYKRDFQSGKIVFLVKRIFVGQVTQKQNATNQFFREERKKKLILRI